MNLRIGALCSLLALPFTLALALGHGFSHDEGQHLAAGVLLAREGLLPYRDFPYFHLPYLVYAYAALASLTEQYFLAARLFSAACAALTAGAIGAAAWQFFPSAPQGRRALIAAGAVLLLLSAPLFGDTIGHCWNQEPSVLLALLAFLLHRSAQTGPRLLVSGLLLGLAIGFRITIAPLVLPFALWLWWNTAARWRSLAWFAAGLTVALLPAAWAFLTSPRGFIFGNLEFPKLAVEYRFANGEPRTMTLPKKLRFLFKEIMRPNWMLFFVFVVGCLTLRWRTRLPRAFWFLLLTLPFLLLGGIAPSPVFDQYFYPLLPFLVLGLLGLLAASEHVWIWRAAAAVVVIAVATHLRPFAEIAVLARPQKWTSTQLHADALALRAAVPAGKVLTLNPALPAEAGLSIYPALATGPFAWRVASLVPPRRRAELRLLAPDDILATLEADPPAAILLGAEKKWEKPLLEYARSHRERPTDFADQQTLWLVPPL